MGCIVTIALVWYAVHRLRVAARQSETAAHLQGILHNLHNYNTDYRHLPATTVKNVNGEALSSWRFITAAFLLGDTVQVGYYGQHAHRNRPWDSEANKRYLDGPYRDYAGSPLSYIDESRPGNKARFVAIEGPGTAFDENNRWLMKDLPTDLIVVVEAHSCQFHWMEPGGDLNVRSMPQKIGAMGGIGPTQLEQKAFYVGFADTSVWLLRTDIPFEELAKFLTIAEAKRYDRDTVLRPYAIRVWK